VFPYGGDRSGVKGVKDYAQFTNAATAMEVGQSAFLNETGTGLVLAWPGPSRLTRGEISFTKQMGFRYYTTASMSALNVAS
jgi:hypothetical protein